MFYKITRKRSPFSCKFIVFNNEIDVKMLPISIHWSRSPYPNLSQYRTWCARFSMPDIMFAQQSSAPRPTAKKKRSKTSVEQCAKCINNFENLRITYIFRRKLCSLVVPPYWYWYGHPCQSAKRHDG